MPTTRITISSLFVTAMSVYACLLLADAPVLARQVAVVIKSQTVSLAQEGQPTSETQSKRHATVNTLPLTEFVSRMLKMAERGELDLNSTFEIIIESDRDSEGVLHNLQISQSSGDPNLGQVAEQFVIAINDSRTLAFLKEAKKLRLKFDSNKADLTASLSFRAESSSRARSLASGYDFLFWGASADRRGRAEAIIYKNLHASSFGDQVNVTFTMPRETFCALLSKYLSSN